MITFRFGETCQNSPSRWVLIGRSPSVVDPDIVSGFFSSALCRGAIGSALPDQFPRETTRKPREPEVNAGNLD